MEAKLRDFGDLRRAADTEFAISNRPSCVAASRNMLDLPRRRAEALHQDARDEALLATLTGLCATELKRLQFGWVEPGGPESKTPYILRLPETATKTRRERTVGLPAEAFEIIKRRFEADPEAEYVLSQRNFKRHRAEVSQLILGGKEGLARPANANGRRSDYARGTQKNITLRDLRHSYISDGLAATGDPTAVMRTAGHSDLKTTEIYLTATAAQITAVGIGAALALKRAEPQVDDSSDDDKQKDADQEPKTGGPQAEDLSDNDKEEA